MAAPRYWQIASELNGWLTPREGRFLHETAASLSPGAHVLEIGSFLGRSTVCIAHGNDVRVTSVDPHIGSPKHEHLLGCLDTYPHFLQTLKRTGIREQVDPIHKASADAVHDVERPIDFLFIDGSHEEADVQRDFDDWYPKVKPGGIIAFHDSWHMSGARRVTNRILYRSAGVVGARLHDTITVMKKAERPTAGERFSNRAFLVKRALIGFVGFLRLYYRGTRLERVPPLRGRGASA